MAWAYHLSNSSSRDTCPPEWWISTIQRTRPSCPPHSTPWTLPSANSCRLQAVATLTYSSSPHPAWHLRSPMTTASPRLCTLRLAATRAKPCSLRPWASPLPVTLATLRPRRILIPWRRARLLFRAGTNFRRPYHLTAITAAAVAFSIITTTSAWRTNNTISLSTACVLWTKWLLCIPLRDSTIPRNWPTRSSSDSVHGVIALFQIESHHSLFFFSLLFVCLTRVILRILEVWENIVTLPVPVYKHGLACVINHFEFFGLPMHGRCSMGLLNWKPFGHSRVLGASPKFIEIRGPYTIFFLI